MGGSRTYAYRDGQRLAPGVACDFDRMAADYFRDIGYTLHIAKRGGLRFRSEQLYLWTGWQRRLPGFNMAAHPDDPKAYHVETNPDGARAIDIYDSGPAGVGPSSGTGAGHQWMLDHAHEYGFENEGMTFAKKEPWHKRSTRANPWALPTNIEEDDVSAAEVWNTPVKRTGGSVPAIQELADTKTNTIEIRNALAPIKRGGKQVSVRQEIADTKTNTIAVLAELKALSAAVQALAVAKGADPAAVLNAVKLGVKDALKDVTFTAEIE